MPGTIAANVAVTFFVGLYCIAAGVSGLGHKAHWAGMLDDIDRSPIWQITLGLLGLMFSVPLVVIFAGDRTPVGIFLVVIGWLGLIKSFAIILLPHRFIAISRPLVAHAARGYSFAIIGLGLAIVLLAMVNPLAK